MSLASRNIVFAALCSVNVELAQSGGRQLTARLAHVGGSWWRWGWRESLRVRDSGAPKRRALSVDEVVKRYAVCPVNWLAPELLRDDGPPTAAADVYGLGLVLWEMMYRTIPFGDFSIAQIVGCVGYGRRNVRAEASSGASTETTFLHEVVRHCTKRDPTKRPDVGNLLASMRDAARTYERKRSQRGALSKLSDKTEAIASGFLAGGLAGMASAAKRRSSASTKRSSAAGAGGSLPGEAEEGPRLVCLDDGQWVLVDCDLVEQFPDDEEKWRALMSLRARLRDADHDPSGSPPQ
eukprot:TRINITY_DN26217_c0_g2_i2.p1 TRINITY_DN26217_c0_g2~~TRINITY_DN26217_c0_g2_i2.p1  ORF type:complete len:294 (-),score=51.78 TRINITY_DN26217_c0_g2_i2:122-1003(-)